jgi:hypothetical protein
MICKFSRIATLDAAQSTEKKGDLEASVNRLTGGRKKRQKFGLRQKVIAAFLLSCILFAPSRSESVPQSNADERLVLELSALGKQGDTIARAREQVLEILQKENACTSWFEEVDPAPAEVFRSLHFDLVESGPSRVYGMRNDAGRQVFKHPWGARSIENAGRSSFIQLNAHGPFFSRTAIVMQVEPGEMLSRPAGSRVLLVSSYAGNTPEAQIAILLHELGHIIGRLPEDDDSWDGRSSRNTSEVLRHCRAEAHAEAHKNSTGGS